MALIRRAAILLALTVACGSSSLEQPLEFKGKGSALGFESTSSFSLPAGDYLVDWTLGANTVGTQPGNIQACPLYAGLKGGAAPQDLVNEQNPLGKHKGEVRTHVAAGTYHVDVSACTDWTLAIRSA